MDIVRENINYKIVKKEHKLWKWIANNQILSIALVLTIVFSTINILLIMNFFKILSNF